MLIPLLEVACGKQSLASTPDLPVAAALRLFGPPSADAGVPFALTVSAIDDGGTPVSGFTGAVHFSSSDPAARLPSDYTFSGGDNGSHTFVEVVLESAGSQSISAADVVHGFTSSLTISVSVPVTPIDGGLQMDAGASDSGVPDAGIPLDPGSLFDAGNADAGAPAGGGTIFTGNDAGLDWILQAASMSGGVTPTKLIAQQDGSVIGVGYFAASSGALDVTQFDVGDLSPIALVPPSNANEIWLAQWDNTGSLRWAGRAGGPREDVAQDAQMLADGTLLVTGQVTLGDGAATSRTLYFARYGSDGTLASVRFNGTNALAGASSGSSIAAYSDGSFTICGSIEGIGIFGVGEAGEVALTSTSTNGGAFLAHYNADQTLAWARLVDVSPGKPPLNMDHCAPTPAGGIFAGGVFMGSITLGAQTLTSVSTGSGDAWLASFAADGTPQWARSYPASAASGSSEIDAIEVTSSGDVIVGGVLETGTLKLGATTITTSEFALAGFFARISSVGDIVWAKGVSDGDSDDVIRLMSMTPGPAGSFYAAGYFDGSLIFGAGEPAATTINGVADPEFGSTGFFARFSETDGTLQLARALNSTRQTCFSGASASAVRPDGELLLAGRIAGVCVFGPMNATPVTLTSVGFGDLFLSAWYPN